MTQILDGSREVQAPPGNAGWEHRRRIRLRPELWIALLALVSGFGFAAVSVLWNDGRLFAPLDDVYIHLQYGKQLGSGHFFQFNAGDEISAGASSMLYAFILGAAYAIGFHGTLLLVFAVVFNIFCFAAAAATACVLGTRLVNRTVGIWTGVLVALSGALSWGAASGMEVGLVMLLVTGLLATFVIERTSARFRFTPLVAALLALSRPEGLIFAGSITCAVLWTLWTHRRTAGASRTLRLAGWSLLPAAVGAGQLLFYKLATGTASANGVQSKSMLHDRPEFYLGEFADRTMAMLRGLVDIFLGFHGQDFAFPGALLLSGLGAAYLLTDRGRRPLVIAALAGLAAAVLSLSTLVSALVHELRYFQPFMPLFLLFVVSGVYAISRVVPQLRARRFALHAGLTMILVFSLVAMPTWAVRFARAAAAIRDSDVSYAAWIMGNVPPGAIVAIKDVGAVAYLGDHRVVDLIGLGTNGFAQASNNGVGSVYEKLRRLPEAKRPGYFAAYETGPGVPMSPLKDAGILVQPAEASFDVHTPPDADGGLIVPFRTFAIYRADWRLAGSGDACPVRGEVRDYVNVADLDGESAHSYAFLPAQKGIQPWTVLTRQGNTIDSGRTIMGGESFTAHNLVPGKPTTLVARTAMHGTVPESTVLVNGRPAGTWTRVGGTSGWQTYTFTIPGDLITSPEVRIDLQQPRPMLNAYPDYTSYGYWFVQ
ncbi:hypothetical protein ORV05_27325 [Amycolatopsis cynarae]|uniref:Uncharacterized protein n=1 Tax=Amycolatopsis cynarae TaxID=2995223 RepID=A0ABY7AXA8_9PSEU|nr:hypothetical protein [Amycolatopsis sp. HUAS 11-8]WAL64645.1 hypothetical protein ORV05_27325 [Amycolatopsis sp. HUAS 11-8]